MDQLSPGTEAQLTDLDQRALDLFRDAARLLGQPKSIGEIYGLLYLREQPLHLDSIVATLGISKGSASQGLKILRQLGAVLEAEVPGQRRVHYTAATELKRLLGGFIQHEIRPHLRQAEQSLNELRSEAEQATNSHESREFYEERLSKLQRWITQAKIVLPLVQRVMGA